MTQNSLGKHYWSRVYFHGGDKDLPHDEARAEPRPDDVEMFEGRYHVSVPFRSTATDRYMIAITVKIFGKQKKDGIQPVIGLLGRTIHLDQFRGRFIERIQNRETRKDQIDREIALVDTRNQWQLLDHSWIADVAEAATKDTAEDNGFTPEFKAEAERLWQDRDAFYERLRVSDKIVKRFESIQPDADGHVELRLSNYRDPVGEIDSPTAEQYRGDWFAALYQVKVGKAPWVVIIQERAENTRESVNRMSSSAIQYGLLAILTSIIGLLAVWWFVIRTMKNIAGK